MHNVNTLQITDFIYFKEFIYKNVYKRRHKKATAKIAYGRFNLCRGVVYLRLMEISY